MAEARVKGGEADSLVVPQHTLLIIELNCIATTSNFSSGNPCTDTELCMKTDQLQVRPMHGAVMKVVCTCSYLHSR